MAATRFLGKFETLAYIGRVSLGGFDNLLILQKNLQVIWEHSRWEPRRLRIDSREVKSRNCRLFVQFEDGMIYVRRRADRTDDMQENLVHQFVNTYFMTHFCSENLFIYLFFNYSHQSLQIMYIYIL